MVSMFPLVRRDSGDETLALISGRDSLRGTEEDPELHLILSDLIKELDQYYFLSLLRFKIFTQKKLSICLPLQVYRKNICLYLLDFSGTALLTLM